RQRVAGRGRVRRWEVAGRLWLGGGCRFRSPQDSADLVQVSKDFLVRLDHGGLVVGDRLLLTEALDDQMCFFELVASQSGEQVVHDLVAASPVPDVDERSRDHVAGREELLVEEV